MAKRTGFIFVFLMMAGTAFTQVTPGFLWTLLPPAQMAEIVGEASGETALHTIIETGGYNKNRPTDEYSSTFYEAQYIFDQLKKYGLPGAELARLPGDTVWDGIKGELWEVEPIRQKLASYQDMTAMLASGSTNTDVTAELVWVGQGTKAEIQAQNVAGKIVVTEGSIGMVHSQACLQMGAAGVIAISQSRPTFDPLQIPWSGLRGRRGSETRAKFGFHLPFREGYNLKRRLLRNQKIIVHAHVESQTLPYELQLPTCHIPGTDPDAGEIIFSAHLFEGYVKQGANDNKSGSASILEVARTLSTLIQEGRLPRPRRTIRFLWGPEYSGTGPWVKEHRELMEKTLCDINMDMVGEWLSLNQAFMCLMRTSYGNAHYINDVMENYYRYVGEGNRERIQLRRNAYRYPLRIVAPSGADEPFVYSIETHYGSSDHEVFNDWGVQVPGVMMIAWPDQWYHTSGDRMDKSDPTQLKRTVVIGAAAAYTIANADDSMAEKIASEVMSNGSRRLGHQVIRGFELMNQAGAPELAKAYKQGWCHLTAALRNEKATLNSILELALDKSRVERHIQAMKKAIDAIGKVHFDALEAHMTAAAARLKVNPVRVEWSPEELKAAKIFPRPTSKVKEMGYRGYSDLIDQVPESIRKKYPYRRTEIGNTSELQCLIDGKSSVLDLKIMLDAQYDRPSDITAVLNFLEVLKAAGLIEM